MTTIQERLQLVREPLDKWSIREQLCLAVARNSDQNLTSVSRALKPFGEANRPADWFHQKNCATQYGALLANVETPKRKKRASGGESLMETPSESILRKLLHERKAELQQLLAEEKSEYLKLQKDLEQLQSGKVSEEQLDKWCREIDEEEQRREQEAQTHAQWLREREQRKQEIDRVWRPAKPPPLALQTSSTSAASAILKRKHSESLDGGSSGMDIDSSDERPATPGQHEQQAPPPKPALSPLLTSLLKSPSQLPNVATSSILHSAITNTRSPSTNTNTNPMIASLLSSSSSAVPGVSPGLQQLVSSAIGQPDLNDAHLNISAHDMLDDANLPNLKIDDLASSILTPDDGQLPEMKNDVDVIISDLMDNAHDIVADPEQHLQLDGNGDININMELEDFEDEIDIKDDDTQQQEKSTPSIDPFEFQEDPEIFEPAAKKQQQQQQVEQKAEIETLEAIEQHLEEVIEKEVIKPEVVEVEPEPVKKHGSVEIVEVVVMEDEGVDKVLNKSQIEDIVHSSVVKVEEKREEPAKEVAKEPAKVEEPPAPPPPPPPPPPPLTPPPSDVIEIPSLSSIEECETQPPSSSTTKEEKQESNISLDVGDASDSTTLNATDFNEELYDDITMEVKVDKTGKAKRDYSRTKVKKDEKDFDMLLAIEKAHRDDGELAEESFSDRDLSDAKDSSKSKVKNENERSNSPWTEEEDVASLRMKRRVSTPATPNDSIPNSPVSSIYYYDDDRDYKNWKKAVMLVYSRIAANRYASLFSKPITDDQAPGYHSVVYRPMDLHTIRKNIETGVIRTTQEFQRDVLLMFNNAIMYNKTNATVYNMARQMQQECVQQIQLFLQAQSQVDAPLRRETRTGEQGLKRKRVVTDTPDNSRNKKRKED